MNLYSFYRSKEWESLLQVLKLERATDNGIMCEYCGKPIIRAYDCIGHHKKVLTEENCSDASIALNPDNIEFVHHKCHNILHNKLGYTGRQVYLVYGSPLSGKSTWTASVAEPGDLVVDLDSIWQCVSGQERYIKPERLKTVVFAVRDTLLEAVQYRRGKWMNAYIIGGYPFAAERERLLDRLGAREIYMDSSREECMNRLMECTDRDHAEWETYIDAWWKQYAGGY